MTPSFSQRVWHEAIPNLFASTRGISLDAAKKYVFEAYDQIGDHNPKWYDITYWFQRFSLNDHNDLLISCKQDIQCYPEVERVLLSLSKKYDLIAISNSTREFLNLFIEYIGYNFKETFSTLSEFGGLKTANRYRQICQHMHISPQSLLHVGDSRQFDYDEPMHAGIKAYYLDRQGQQSCPGTITDLDQLCNILL